MIPNDFLEYFQSLDLSQRQQIVDQLLLLISSPIGNNSSLLDKVQSKTAVSCPNCGSHDIRANGK